MNDKLFYKVDRTTVNYVKGRTKENSKKPNFPWCTYIKNALHRGYGICGSVVEAQQEPPKNFWGKVYRGLTLTNQQNIDACYFLNDKLILGGPGFTGDFIAPLTALMFHDQPFNGLKYFAKTIHTHGIYPARLDNGIFNCCFSVEPTSLSKEGRKAFLTSMSFLLRTPEGKKAQIKYLSQLLLSNMLIENPEIQSHLSFPVNKSFWDFTKEQLVVWALALVGHYSKEDLSKLSVRELFLLSNEYAFQEGLVKNMFEAFEL